MACRSRFACRVRPGRHARAAAAAAASSSSSEVVIPDKAEELIQWFLTATLSPHEAMYFFEFCKTKSFSDPILQACVRTAISQFPQHLPQATRSRVYYVLRCLKKEELTVLHGEYYASSRELAAVKSSTTGLRAATVAGSSAAAAAASSSAGTAAGSSAAAVEPFEVVEADRDFMVPDTAHDQYAWKKAYEICGFPSERALTEALNQRKNTLRGVMGALSSEQQLEIILLAIRHWYLQDNYNFGSSRLFLWNYDEEMLEQRKGSALLPPIYGKAPENNLLKALMQIPNLSQEALRQSFHMAAIYDHFEWMTHCMTSEIHSNLLDGATICGVLDRLSPERLDFVLARGQRYLPNNKEDMLKFLMPDEPGGICMIRAATWPSNARVPQLMQFFGVSSWKQCPFPLIIKTLFALSQRQLTKMNPGHAKAMKVPPTFEREVAREIVKSYFGSNCFQIINAQEGKRLSEQQPGYRSEDRALLEAVFKWEDFTLLFRG